jgi:hypothetical protein
MAVDFCASSADLFVLHVAYETSGAALPNGYEQDSIWRPDQRLG